MNLENIKNFAFKYDNTGEVDIYSQCILNCFEQKIYFVLKNQYSYIKNFPFALLNNISIYVPIVNQHYISRIYTTDEGTIDFIHLNKTYCKGGKEDSFDKTVCEIDSLLNKGKFVIVQTFIERLKFTRYYNPEIPFSEHIPSHSFMIIDSDKENFYCLESEWVVNKNPLYIPCSYNSEFGVVNKFLLKESFDKYANLYTVILDKSVDYEEEIDNYAISNLLHSIEIYYSDKKDTSDNFIIYYGREALEILIQMCTEGRNNLCEKIYIISESGLKLTNDTLFYSLKASFDIIIARKNLLLNYFIFILKPDCIYYKDIVDALKNNIKCWQIITNLIFKIDNQSQIKNIKTVYLDNSFKGYFENVLKSEDYFMNILKQNLESIIETISNKYK